MKLSRRDALLGATAAAVVTGAITAPLALKAAGVKAALASTDPAIATGHWHKAFAQVFGQAEWWVSHQNPNLDELNRDPALAQEYAEHRKALRVAGQAVSEARKRLLAKAPVTAAGAVALLGCASRVMMEQRCAREDTCATGTRARVAFCVLDSQGQEAMVLAAQPVLERLARGAPSITVGPRTLSGRNTQRRGPCSSLSRACQA